MKSAPSSAPERPTSPGPSSGSGAESKREPRSARGANRTTAELDALLFGSPAPVSTVPSSTTSTSPAAGTAAAVAAAPSNGASAHTSGHTSTNTDGTGAGTGTVGK